MQIAKKHTNSMKDQLNNINLTTAKISFCKIPKVDLTKYKHYESSKEKQFDSGVSDTEPRLSLLENSDDTCVSGCSK